MLGTYIHMYMSLWCICNLIEPILRHRKWLNNHIIQGPDNVLVYVYVSSRGHESCLSHAFWVLPHSERKRQNKPFQIETFHCFFSSPLQFKASPLPTFFAKQVFYGLPVWGSYSIERVAFLEPHDFVPEVCMEYPQYTYYIYILCIYIYIYIYIYIHIYILYSYIN